ncbi:MAG TPA: DUF2339 domain-containing protein [Vicinamibacterales bacterium]|nr:DUF2339 domain-containing protein [Vicinamibacterales bacterium]
MDGRVAIVVGGVLLATGGVLLGALFGIFAFIRTNRLEGRLRALEARVDRAGAEPAAGPPAIAPSAPAVAAVDPGPGPAAATVAPAPAAVAVRHDLETQIAGRWLNRVGLTAVAVGVSYFLKYAIDNDWIGPSGQVALGILLGAALIGAAPMLIRRGYVYFADGLTGLGASILYLSVWAGGSYYRLFSPTTAFAGMIAITGGMLAIAIGRNAQRVAVIALLGGFLTPILVSSGRDADRELFVYLALLDAALLVVVANRAWRLIEWPAFLFTQLYFWGTLFSTTARTDTLVYASVFFAEFAILPMLAARRLPALRIDHAWLVIVNAAVCLWAYHGILWPEHRWALTGATIAIAVLHLIVAQAVPAVSTGVAQARLLFAGVALSLLTVAIPMRMDGRWLTFAWAVEAAVLLVTGFRAHVGQMRVLGYLLYFLVVARIIAQWPDATRFLLNPRAATIAATIASMAAVLWTARAHRDQWKDGESLLLGLMSVTMNVLALVGLTAEVSLYFRPMDYVYDYADRSAILAEGLTISLLWTLYATALLVAGVRFRLAGLRWQGLALFGIATLKVFLGDLAELSGFYRIASSVALGIVLLIVSFLYQRTVKTEKAAGQ